MCQQSRSVFFRRAWILVKLTTFDNSLFQRCGGSNMSSKHSPTGCHCVRTEKHARNHQRADLWNGTQEVPQKSSRIWICHRYVFMFPRFFSAPCGEVVALGASVQAAMISGEAGNTGGIWPMEIDEICDNYLWKMMMYLWKMRICLWKMMMYLWKMMIDLWTIGIFWMYVTWPEGKCPVWGNLFHILWEDICWRLYYIIFPFLFGDVKK